MHKKLLSLAPYIFISSLGSAQTFDLPGGAITIDETGTFAGTVSETTPVPGYPDESETTDFSGSISPSGDISGSFSGVATYNEVNDSGDVVSVTESYSGGITGTISNTGDYSVSWGGPEPDSDSGTLSGFSLPSGGGSGTGSVVGSYSSPTEPRRGDDSDSQIPSAATAAALAAQDPQYVIRKLREIPELCKGTGAYLVDCLSERLGSLEKDIRKVRGQEEVANILGQASRDLRTVAQENRDPNRSRATIRTQDNRLRTNRALTPIAPENQSAAIEQAIAIIDTAETQLLRSAVNSPNALKFQNIASALGSNKVLLRSI